jgi:hypothetical protein
VEAKRGRSEGDKAVGRREKGEGRREKGEGRREKGEGRREKRRREGTATQVAASC